MNRPHYFADYETTVAFISQEELDRDHAIPLMALRCAAGKAARATGPEFTFSMLAACARAAHGLAMKGEQGARTAFDIPLGLLSAHTPEVLRRDYL